MKMTNNKKFRGTTEKSRQNAIYFYIYKEQNN